MYALLIAIPFFFPGEDVFGYSAKGYHADEAVVNIMYTVTKEDEFQPLRYAEVEVTKLERVDTYVCLFTYDVVYHPIVGVVYTQKTHRGWFYLNDKVNLYLSRDGSGSFHFDDGPIIFFRRLDSLTTKNWDYELQWRMSRSPIFHQPFQACYP